MAIQLTNNQLNRTGYWSIPIKKLTFYPTYEDIDLFDQNGYDLTELEKHYASYNMAGPDSHRCHRTALKTPWFVDDNKTEGSHLNHSLLFERKAYTGAALAQLKMWAENLPILNKIVALRPKWGLDFSMDYADRDGNAFEVLHWEYDSFDYEEVEIIKLQVQTKISNIDWDYAAEQILQHKDDWHYLDFFAQSNWKCNYFGIPKERFKMVAWQ